MEGLLSYTGETPCDPEAPSCYRLTRQVRP
jgi:hypothetical protein